MLSVSLKAGTEKIRDLFIHLNEILWNWNLRVLLQD